MDDLINGLMDRSISMEGWFDGLMDGWMDGSINALIDGSINLSINV